MWNYELIFGLICFIIGILLGVREIKLWNNLEQNDYIRKSFSIQKIGGIIGLLLIGIATFYRYFT
ncbi:hypothetical protein SAMN05421766_1023 [Zobellia uliginosa]|uniref:Immunity protein 17 n=1 Tax=Zobellia uliginosa TaxID=143224 RepID=A0ABY1KNB2_9FLAO|nr:hypothetical protein SAMN05421766_1023 [Zobellia uliginosa]